MSHLHPSGFQRIYLSKQARHVHNHAVSNDALRARVQDARGNEVQRVLFASGVVNGVTRVGPALQKREKMMRPWVRASRRCKRDAKPRARARETS